MSNLSADHREILDLVYYQENSIEDCALILGIPAATVKTRMFYARKKLAELVVEEAVENSTVVGARRAAYSEASA